MSPSQFQHEALQGFGFCGLIRHFHVPVRLFKIVRVQCVTGTSYWKATLGSTHTG